MGSSFGDLRFLRAVCRAWLGNASPDCLGRHDAIGASHGPQEIRGRWRGVCPCLLADLRFGRRSEFLSKARHRLRSFADRDGIVCICGLHCRVSAHHQLLQHVPLLGLRKSQGGEEPLRVGIPGAPRTRGLSCDLSSRRHRVDVLPYRCESYREHGRTSLVPKRAAHPSQDHVGGTVALCDPHRWVHHVLAPRLQPEPGTVVGGRSAPVACSAGRRCQS